MTGPRAPSAAGALVPVPGTNKVATPLWDGRVAIIEPPEEAKTP